MFARFVQEELLRAFKGFSEFIDNNFLYGSAVRARFLLFDKLYDFTFTLYTSLKKEPIWGVKEPYLYQCIISRYR